jgi:Bacteriocin-protection, YdeI or OmpD-Associated/Domain of unknown function (DUF1905)
MVPDVADERALVPAPGSWSAVAALRSLERSASHAALFIPASTVDTVHGMKRFQAAIAPIRGGGYFVVVPEAVAAAAGLRYGARVRGTIDGVAYHSSLMRYSGVFHMGVHKATLAAAGVAAGDEVAVAIEIDDEPLPTDTVPPDLAKALAKNSAAKAGFMAQSPAHKREHVKYILEAKQAATRERRIAKTITTLAAVVPKSKPARRKARPAAARR